MNFAHEFLFSMADAERWSERNYKSCTKLSSNDASEQHKVIALTYKLLTDLHQYYGTGRGISSGKMDENLDHMF